MMSETLLTDRVRILGRRARGLWRRARGLFPRARHHALDLVASLLHLSADPFGREAPVRELRHMPVSAGGAVDQAMAIADINRKIQSGFFAERLVFLTAAPKSASRVVDRSLRILQAELEASPISRKPFRKLVSRVGDDLHAEHLLDLVQGGILSRHLLATNQNLRMLDLLGSKQIILLRHPAALVVGMYCHRLRNYTYGTPPPRRGYQREESLLHGRLQACAQASLSTGTRPRRSRALHGDRRVPPQHLGLDSGLAVPSESSTLNVVDLRAIPRRSG